MMSSLILSDREVICLSLAACGLWHCQYVCVRDCVCVCWCMHEFCNCFVPMWHLLSIPCDCNMSIFFFILHVLPCDFQSGICQLNHMGTGHEKQSCFEIRIMLIYLCNTFRTKSYEAALTETVTAHNQGKCVRVKKWKPWEIILKGSFGCVIKKLSNAICNATVMQIHLAKLYSVSTEFKLCIQADNTTLKTHLN